MEITEETPMMIPKTVRPERTLAERRVASAARKFSRAWEEVMIAISRTSRPRSDQDWQRASPDRFQKTNRPLSSAPCQDRDPSLHRGREWGVSAQQQRHQEAQSHADNPAHNALQHALRDELAGDIEFGCPDGAAHSNFAAPRGYTHQHHIHNDDSADDHGNRADHDEDRKKRRTDAAPQRHIAFLRA